MTRPDRRPLGPLASPFEVLISRLEGVRHSNAHAVRAVCANCGGKSLKLSVGETSTGAVLIHCFGGCSALDVLESVGLTLSDLFPVPLNPTTPDERREAERRMREVRWAAALVAVPKELAVVEIAGRQIAQGKPLDDQDQKRLLVAIERILSARMALRIRDTPWKPGA